MMAAVATAEARDAIPKVTVVRPTMTVADVMTADELLKPRLRLPVGPIGRQKK